MTIRYPQKYTTLSRAIRSEITTHTFSGVKSGVTLTQIKLLRLTPQQAVDLWSNGEINKGIGGSSYTTTMNTRMSTEANARQWSINMDTTVNGTSNGWIFVKTSDNQGNELVDGWELWWPKESATYSYYDLNASAAANTALSFDRWPGNFTAVENDDIPSSLVAIQDFQETSEDNRKYQVYALYDAWLKSRGSDPLDGEKNTVSGVELVVHPVRHTYYTDQGGGYPDYYVELGYRSDESGIAAVGAPSYAKFVNGLIETILGINSEWNKGMKTRVLGSREIYYLKLGYQWGVINDPADSGTNRFFLKDNRIIAGARRTSTTDYIFPSTSSEYNLTTQFNFRATLDQWIDKEYHSRSVTGSSLMPADNLIPLYWDGTSLKRMSYADIVDTFIVPTLQTMLGNGFADQTEDFKPYTVSTSSSISNYYPGKAIYYDTRIDRDQYQFNLSPTLYNGKPFGYLTTDGAAEARDQPVTVKTYRLFTKNKCVAATTKSQNSVEYMAFDAASNSIVGVTNSQLAAALVPLLNYHMCNDETYSIRYSLTNSGISGSTINSTEYNSSISLGTTMQDTSFNEDTAGLVVGFYGGTDDYRTQVMPVAANQSASNTTNTINLRMYAISTP
jgi:hypothetical protein